MNEFMLMKMLEYESDITVQPEQQQRRRKVNSTWITMGIDQVRWMVMVDNMVGCSLWSWSGDVVSCDDYLEFNGEIIKWNYSEVCEIAKLSN